MIPWKGIGIAVGAAVSGAFAGTTAAAAIYREPTTAVEAMRQDLREFRAETNTRLDKLTAELSHLEGYVAGRERTK